ncbi:MAG: peptidoglycan-binding protein [Pseudorhodoplanes sp.]|nr:peptidoglycan-binding protein [Pseudorhodoplanes sp.]
MRRIGPIMSLLLLAALPEAGQAAPRKAAAVPADQPAPQAVRDAYAEMPLAERLALQSDLIWSGDYNGGLDGDFGDRAIAAVKAFQRRNKGKDTGLLTPQERATLAAAVKDQQEQVGWKLVEDSTIPGVRLGIPGKLATLTARGKSGGRWHSSRGEVQIEVFRESIAGNTTFATLFERQKTGPKGRNVEYNVMRNDFFVLSGLQGLKKFYVRAQLKDNEVRGMTILYDQALEGIMQPVVVAMSSAFAPFGSDTAPVRRKVEYATAIAVSPAGHFIADRAATDDCQTIVIAGAGPAERVADEKSADLALLRVYGMEHSRTIALSNEPPRSADLTLVGISDPTIQEGGNAPSTASARIRGVEGATVLLEPAPAAGFSGAAALDAQGRFVGMVGVRATNGGSAAAARAAFVPAATIRKFLAAGNVTPQDGSASIDAAKASVARVICVRK